MTKKAEDVCEPNGPSANGDLPDSELREMSMAALCDHIVRRHHRYIREEDERITNLLERVCAAHEGEYPELLAIQRTFGALRLELENHLLKEEKTLFPFIALMESSLALGRPVPHSPFGSTRNPVAVMLKDHDAAYEFLRAIRRLSNDLAVPGDASASFATLYRSIRDFEEDLHKHTHLEDDILFPKAIDMEIKGIRAIPDLQVESKRSLPVHNPKHH
jgi:regulator of cell morphogenesis and NO signaling